MTAGRQDKRIWAYAAEVIARTETLHGGALLLPMLHRGDRPGWPAPVDIYETPTEIHLVVALPGVARESVDVTVQEGELVVRGFRRLPLPEGAVLRRLEIPQGHFERRLPLPPGRFELTPWTLADGCLHLSFRRLEREGADDGR